MTSTGRGMGDGQAMGDRQAMGDGRAMGDRRAMGDGRATRTAWGMEIDERQASNEKDEQTCV